MERFWALAFILFTAAMIISAVVEAVERRVDYYAKFR
jgi:NitT/TauT family transport system permease protein